MFSSPVLYVVMAVATIMLLVAILWLRKRKLGVKVGGMTKEVEVVTGVPETVLAVEEVPLPGLVKKRGQCVELIGELDFNEGASQLCVPCKEEWFGIPIVSGRCPRCGDELVTVTGAEMKLWRRHLRVSPERLRNLLDDINQRIRERARWASSVKA